jgi:hypothetical protein
VKQDPGKVPLAGLSICNVTVSGEAYPVQLDVNSANGSLAYAGDLGNEGGTALSGVGDKAFTYALGVEALKGDVDIQGIGPAGPVLSKNYTLATAIAKAMVSALK